MGFAVHFLWIIAAIFFVLWFVGFGLGRGNAGRHQFYTVRLLNGAAYPAFKGSGDITSLSQADGYIEIAADQRLVDEGSLVDVTLF